MTTDEVLTNVAETIGSTLGTIVSQANKAKKELTTEFKAARRGVKRTARKRTARKSLRTAKNRARRAVRKATATSRRAMRGAAATSRSRSRRRAR